MTSPVNAGIRQLSVPVDGTPEGERAIPLALAFAARLRARVTLVHVTAPRSVPVDDAGTENALTTDAGRAAAREYLTDLERRVTTSPHLPGVAVDATLLAGEPAAEISEHARRAGAELIVLPTHAHGAVGRVLLGSVAREVVRRSGVPAILLPPHATGVALPRHVLLPSDGSELAERMADVVAPLAVALGARCTVLGVVDPIAAAASLLPAESGSGADLADAMARTVARLSAGGVDDAAATVLARGRPAAGVTEYAEAHDVGLIALATHAERGIGRLLAGSVADGVVHAARCPVLLWHPRQLP